ncbi:MAG: hypothetical protein ACE5K7_04465 [Phycisphaerae bacterium]
MNATRQHSDQRPGEGQAEVAGYVDRPLPRWVLVLSIGAYLLWLGFLLAMLWVRVTDPHY